MAQPLPPPLAPGQPLTALAPMQDVTDLAFMRVVAAYGAPDYFFTEFFRVHAQSRPERHILRSIDENDTGRPVFAQLIGEDIPHLVRTAAELAEPSRSRGSTSTSAARRPRSTRRTSGAASCATRRGSAPSSRRSARPCRASSRSRCGSASRTTANFDRILDIVNVERGRPADGARADRARDVPGRGALRLHRPCGLAGALPGPRQRQRHLGREGGRGRAGHRRQRA